MVADVDKWIPDKRPVASIVSCERAYLQEIVQRLDSDRVHVVRAEPAATALLRLAVAARRGKRRWKLAIRFFLGEDEGLALLTVDNRPIVSRQFAIRRGDEANAIVSTGRTLLTMGTQCGVEAPLDAVIIHGRSNLARLLDDTWMRDSLAADVEWISTPAFNPADIAKGVALGCVGEAEHTFDLAGTMKPKVTLWDLFPVREFVVQMALLLVLTLVLWNRAHTIEREYVAAAQENARQMETSLSRAALEKEKDSLQQRVSAVGRFLGNRILWTSYERRLAAQLPETVYLTSFQGVAEMSSGGKRRRGRAAAKKSLVLRGAVSIPQDGLIPHEIDRLLNMLRDDELLDRDFPNIELAALKQLQNTGDNNATAMFTVLCLPKAKGKR